MHTQARDKSTYLEHCHKRSPVTAWNLSEVALLFYSLRFICFFHSENSFDSNQLNRDYNLLHWNSQLARIYSLWFCCFFTLPLLSAHGSQITRSQNDIMNLLLPGNGTIKYLNSRLFFRVLPSMCRMREPRSTAIPAHSTRLPLTNQPSGSGTGLLRSTANTPFWK